VICRLHFKAQHPPEQALAPPPQFITTFSFFRTEKKNDCLNVATVEQPTQQLERGVLKPASLGQTKTLHCVLNAARFKSSICETKPYNYRTFESRIHPQFKMWATCEHQHKKEKNDGCFLLQYRLNL